MSGRRLFGVETEYAVMGLDRTGAPAPHGTFSRRLVLAAVRSLPHLRGSVHAGIFLSNGSRLYIDAGDHPELAGPECHNPWDAVRYARAGDALMMRLVDLVCRDGMVAKGQVFTGNVDYSGSGSTWGAHENYCHRANPAVLCRRLLPHLVSRVIFCGAGGFNPLSQGLDFTLSPRAHHLRHPVSAESTRDRGIAHTRDEPLAAIGYRRQHLICGEGLRSDLAAWLRVATTAVVVALIEGGVACGDEVELQDPVQALHAFASDPHCTHRVGTIAGSWVTAIEIQRRYLVHAMAHAAAAFMPAWTEAVCGRWDDILTRLAQGPDRVSRSLDWGIKLAMYSDRVQRRGFAWEQLPAWSFAIDQLDHARRAAAPVVPPLSEEVLRTETAGALGPIVKGLEPFLALHGLHWDQLDRFLALRAELLEADTRWGQLGSEGVFHLLDRAGVLDHRVAGVDRFDEAVEHPPEGTRASVRGQVIRREWKRRTQFACSWDHIWDLDSCRKLDLSDPFTEVERWSDPPVAAESDGGDSDTGDCPSGQGSLWEGIGRVLTRARRSARGGGLE
jgi:hypothetical protein